jgi:CTP:molybdopterin cytidylyltransferase MocA
MNPDTEAYQAARQHIFVVNHESAFLDVVRMLLQDERYNVTISRRWWAGSATSTIAATPLLISHSCWPRRESKPRRRGC